GHVPQDALPVIAEALNISKAEVHGVVTFYHDYRSHPAGRHVLKLCQAEACQSMGSDAIAAKLKQLLGIGFHETARDGSVTLEPVYC
ncbi:MAG: formate dehydrogenase subunit gamma, partial [Mesorhizobium sp.]